MTSLANLAGIATEEDEYLRGFTDKALATTYDQFISALYKSISTAIEKLEAQSHLIEHEGEDATTARIIMFLEGAGYDATQANRSGNVDIVVKRMQRGFVWIGEAKKYNSVSDLREGYLQLATRYTPGNSNTGISYGGLIGYLRRPNAKSHVDAWRREFGGLEVARDATITDCEYFGPLAFNSEHPHQGTGMPFRVWHICAKLYFYPQDSSGRESAVGAERAITHARLISEDQPPPS